MRGFLLFLCSTLLLSAPFAHAIVTEQELPEGWTGPSNLAFDNEGTLWLTLDGTWAIARWNMTTNDTRLYPLDVPKREMRDTMGALRFAEDGTIDVVHDAQRALNTAIAQSHMKKVEYSEAGAKMAGQRATRPAETAPAASCATGACAGPRQGRSALLVALVCGAHCSLALLVPLLAVTLTVAGASLGLPLPWIVPPLLIGSAFLWLLWPGIKNSWTKLRDPAPQPANLTETQG